MYFKIEVIATRILHLIFDCLTSKSVIFQSLMCRHGSEGMVYCVAGTHAMENKGSVSRVYL